MNDLFPFACRNGEIAELDAAARRLALREIALAHLPDSDIAAVVGRAADRIDGFGPLSDLMRDGSVTDILINGPHAVWVERFGSLELTSVRFEDHEELAGFIYRVLGDAGVAIDRTHPIADAQLSDGSRIHVVLPPAASGGPLVSIRRFPREPWGLDELVEREMLTNDQSTFLCDAVIERRTIAISGGTGSGKTTLLNALLGRVPPSERVVVIEETPELQPECKHAVSLLTRTSNLEGRGAITADELLRAALRMRPDRIVVGEVRGPEALVALQAMSTGHPGSLITLHADSPGRAIERMTALALQAASGASEASLATTVKDCFEIRVHLERTGGLRRVVAIE